MNFSGIFISRPVATTLLTIGIAFAGILAFLHLSVAPLPQVDFPTLMIQASMSGASPDVMAATVAAPLERHLGFISDVTEMTSRSSLGSTQITLQFALNRDIDGAARDVEAAINAARADLSSNMRSNPTYRKYNPSDSPILLMVLTSSTRTSGQLYDSAATVLQQKLSQIEGIGNVDVGGSSLPAVRIELNPDALAHYGIGLEDVRAALASANANSPKGAIEEGNRHFQIHTNDQATHASDYRGLVIAYRNNRATLLSDIAEVNDSVQSLRNAGSINGKSAVTLVIYKQPGANVIQTVDRIKAILPVLKASMPGGTEMIVTGDRTSTIRASLSDTGQTLFGTEKIGIQEFSVGLNASPPTIQEMADFPIRTVNGITTYVRDVASVRDGFTPQTNIVRFDGLRATMLQIQKNGKASTLDIVKGIKALLERLRPTYPEGLKIDLLTDQSIFVTSAIEGVIREPVIAACLTALMILLFLGSWRSTVIIAISIPLSILSSIIVLSALGETINIMTLGGLALAVGILVDDATVEIENVNRNLDEGKAVEKAILDGASQIAVPAFVSTLCICIVFVPIFFLSGTAKYLFTPLAEAVIFAMLASYFLSRTLVPTLAKYLLVAQAPHLQGANPTRRRQSIMGVFGGIYDLFNQRFEGFREGYRDLLAVALRHTPTVFFVFIGFTAGSMCLVPWLGQDFFPNVDAGQFNLHVRAQSGTRIEEVAREVDEIEGAVRQEVGSQLKGIIDNIGLPYSGINLSYSNTGTASTADSDIIVSLKENHEPTARIVDRIRTRLHTDFPNITASFPPADIVAQNLNFGLPSPLDIQIVGANKTANGELANRLAERIRRVPGAVDVRVQQPFDYPRMIVNVDRSKASDVGISETQVANTVLGALSGSAQVSPNFWVDPKNGVNYQVNIMAPQYSMDSVNALINLPVIGSTGLNPQIIGNLAQLARGSEQPLVTHYNVQPVVDIYGAVDGKDLGSVSSEITKIVEDAKKELPKGSRFEIRGQVQTMRDSFTGLFIGLACAMVLVYLLMVVNFQSWIDPLIIITALPVALAGIVWMLFITRTTLSVPALMGAIMCMGVGTANAVLVITFANEQLEHFRDSYQAALQAGYIRLRPVLMTAFAMIIGMVPMALGLGDGGEQNAPLGRGVIGGLIFATVATLFFVPSVFSLIRRHKFRREEKEQIPATS